MKKQRTALITGGAGFIGSHLSDRLLSLGYKLIILDDLSTGNKENISHIINLPDVSFVKGTVLNKNLVLRLAKKSDIIFHLAAAVGVKLVTDQPLESLLSNVEGTHIALEVARSRGIPILITSSSEVYGKNPNIPFSEDADRHYGSVYNERWGYALSKTVDEFLAICFWRQYKTPVVTVRLFNTVGPRQTGKYGMVIPRFISQAIKNEPITVYGDGTQSRCFCHVKDIVESLVALIDCPAAYGEIVNLGSSEPVTMNDLAKKIKLLVKSSSPIIKISYEKAYNSTFEDMKERIPNTSKASKLVGFKARQGLDQILNSSISFFKDLSEESGEVI